MQIKYLWQYAFCSNPAELSLAAFENSFPSLNLLDSQVLDFLIETGSWDSLSQLRSKININLSPYAVFRIRQLFKQTDPFKALAYLFHNEETVSKFLACESISPTIFRDFGGLGDFVDNLTRLLSWNELHKYVGIFYIEVPFVIFQLFSSTSIFPLLVTRESAWTLQQSGFKYMHLALLIALLEQDPAYQGFRSCLSIPTPRPPTNNPIVCMNWASGFKTDSHRNLFSFTKRSPSFGFWDAFQGGVMDKCRVIDISDFGTYSHRDSLIQLSSLSKQLLLYRSTNVFEIMQSANLVVSVDTFIAHVSLSLCLPTILILPHAYDPRWHTILTSTCPANSYSKAQIFFYDMYGDHRLQGFLLAQKVNNFLRECR